MAKESSAVKLALCNLGLLDRGAAQIGIDRELQKALEDTEDRGGDGKERVVTIKVRLFKLASGMIEITPEVQFTPPPFRTNPTAAQIARDGRQNALFFQPLSPGNPNQEEIPFDSKEPDR